MDLRGAGLLRCYNEIAYSPSKRPLTNNVSVGVGFKFDDTEGSSCVSLCKTGVCSVGRLPFNKKSGDELAVESPAVVQPQYNICVFDPGAPALRLSVSQYRSEEKVPHMKAAAALNPVGCESNAAE